MDQQTLDLRRQLQVIDQEASVLRNKVQSLETENEKLTAENKRLSLLKNTKTSKLDKNKDKYIDQIATLEVELAEKNERIQELEKIGGIKLNDLKVSFIDIFIIIIIHFAVLLGRPEKIHSKNSEEDNSFNIQRTTEDDGGGP